MLIYFAIRHPWMFRLIPVFYYYKLTTNVLVYFFVCNVAASLIDIPKSKMLGWGKVYDILINAAKFPSRKTLPAFPATNIICYLFFLKRVGKIPK